MPSNITLLSILHVCIREESRMKYKNMSIRPEIFKKFKVAQTILSPRSENSDFLENLIKIAMNICSNPINFQVMAKPSEVYSESPERMEARLSRMSKEYNKRLGVSNE